MATGDKFVNLDGLKAVYDSEKAMLAATEASATASSAHAEGTYFIYGGKLYRATDGIGKGDTITPDTNCTAVDLGSEVREVYIGRPVSVTSSVNKMDPSEIESGKRLTMAGTIESDSRFSTTGYIEAVAGKAAVGFTGFNFAGTARVCLPVERFEFFDAQKSVISYIDNTSSGYAAPIPANTKYVRISTSVSYFDERYPMVEFVDSAAGISAEYAAYENVTERSHGIDYLDERQQELILSVDALSDAVDALEDAVDGLDALPSLVAANTACISGLTGAPQTIDHMAAFARGGINSSTGAYDEYYQYRTATPEKITLDKTCVLRIDSGFRAYVFYFDAQGGKISAAWHTEPCTLEKGSIVRIMLARQSENTSETADAAAFSSKATFTWDVNLPALSDDIQNISAVIPHGLTWDWWISANCADTYGNVYIGYVDTDGYAGVLRRQPDGVMQYKRLERSNNDDDHNGMAATVLDDGRILVIGSHGHAVDNHMICYRSINPYSIDEMEKLSFDIPQGGAYSYGITYSQIFKYNNRIFDFCRCTVTASGGNSVTGYLCLISADNGSTWTAYQAVCTPDPYITFAQCTDDSKYLKLVCGVNPSSGANTFKGAVIDLSTYKIYDLNNTEIGQMTALGTGTYNQSACASPADMTSLIAQTADGKKGRLFTAAETAKADTVFLYATAIDTDSSDFTYKLYNNGTVVEIGMSGTPFGNTHYISGICFGNSPATVYYSKATTNKADGSHELHKAKISGNAVAGDEIITEASMCILRPLFLGNGEIAAAVGHYNDQTANGYNGSFTAWELKPLFTHA